MLRRPQVMLVLVAIVLSNACTGSDVDPVGAGGPSKAVGGRGSAVERGDTGGVAGAVGEEPSGGLQSNDDGGLARAGGADGSIGEGGRDSGGAAGAFSPGGDSGMNQGGSSEVPAMQDETPSEQLAILDAAPVVDLLREGLVLPGGVPLEQWLDENPDFLAQLGGELPPLSRRPQGAPAFLVANSSSAREVFLQRLLGCASATTLDYLSALDHPDEGPAKPAHQGLAYVWGGKDPDVRGGNCKPNPNECTTRYYGLDCSGLVTYCANFAGAGFVGCDTATTHLKRRSTWASALKKLSQLKVIELEADRSAASYKDGDIVVWRWEDHKPDPTGHTGVITRTSSGPQVIQSNGSSSGDAAECALNAESTRGPSVRLWDDMQKAYGKYDMARGKHEYDMFAFRIVNQRESVNLNVVGSAKDAGWVDLAVDGTTQAMGCATAPGRTECTSEFSTESNLEVSAVALPGSGAIFVGWSGPDCASAGSSPSLRFTSQLEAINCTATFECSSGQVWDGVVCATGGDVGVQLSVGELICRIEPNSDDTAVSYRIQSSGTVQGSTSDVSAYVVVSDPAESWVGSSDQHWVRNFPSSWSFDQRVVRYSDSGTSAGAIAELRVYAQNLRGCCYDLLHHVVLTAPCH